MRIRVQKNATVHGKTTPIKLIHFHNNLEKWTFPKQTVLIEINKLNLILYRKPKCPYGAHEQLLRDISPNKLPKDLVCDEDSFLKKKLHLNEKVQLSKTTCSYQ